MVSYFFDPFISFIPFLLCPTPICLTLYSLSRSYSSFSIMFCFNVVPSLLRFSDFRLPVHFFKCISIQRGELTPCRASRLIIKADLFNQILIVVFLVKRPLPSISLRIMNSWNLVSTPANKPVKL